MFSCQLFISDTVHNYLYIDANDSSGNGRIVAYRDNSLTQIGFPINSDAYYDGCITDSGLMCVIRNLNNYFYTVDSLTIQFCTYGYCNSDNPCRAMVSKNDTIYFEDDMGAGGDNIVMLSPNGNSNVIGTAG